MNNKFKIIIPSFNNENWVEYNIASVLNQSYSNYEVLYINDKSTDNTFNKVKNIVGKLNNWTIIDNKENKGAQYNYFEHLDTFLNSNDILIHLDGDDWLYDNKVLANLNKYYNKKECWMTYGGFVCWDGSENLSLPNPQSTPYPDFIHKHKMYRNDVWRASHLRTFKGFLIKTVHNDDLKSNIDGEYYWHAADLAHQFPCLEMCPKNKIGVVDFYTHVYNQSNQNIIRTQEREQKNNIKYENEIRNKKKYKEGLSGERLPQVNVFYANMELNNRPTKFSYCYNQSDGDYDLVFLGDESIVNYLEGKIKIKKDVPIVARPFEDRNYWINKWGEPKIFNLLLEHYDKFDLILTLDKILLDKLPNAKFWPANYVSQFNILPNIDNTPPKKSIHWDSFEIPEDETFKIHKKNKLISCISSNKAFLPGHITRLKFIESIKNNSKIDFFGRGIKPIDSKFDALKDYAFSIAIEMIKPGDMYHSEKQIWVDDEYLWSEKINDCFLTGTVPIYYGCPIIGKFFNTDGILIFNTVEELHNILNNLSIEQYKNMLPAIKDNLNRAKKYPLNNDDLYKYFFKDLIKK